MNFIVELVCGVVLMIVLAIFELIVESPNVKKWIKSAMFFMLSQAITAFMAWMSIMTYRNGNIDGCIIVGIITALWGIGMLVAVVYGHFKQWKKDS